MARQWKHARADATLAKLESVTSSIHLRPSQAVDKIMTRDVGTCSADDTLDRCAQIMWERACGCVPVIDWEERPIAMVTDRDVCMAAYTQGVPLSCIPVATMMSTNIHVVGTHATIAAAEAVMRRHGIRRLPVVEEHGRLVGLLSFSDIVTHGHLGTAALRDGLSSDAIAETIACISHVPPVSRW